MNGARLPVLPVAAAVRPQTPSGLVPVWRRPRGHTNPDSVRLASFLLKLAEQRRRMGPGMQGTIVAGTPRPIGPDQTCGVRRSGGQIQKCFIL